MFDRFWDRFWAENNVFVDFGSNFRSLLGPWRHAGKVSEIVSGSCREKGTFFEPKVGNFRYHFCCFSVSNFGCKTGGKNDGILTPKMVIKSIEICMSSWNDLFMIFKGCAMQKH